MANPLTAINADVDEPTVNTLLTNMMSTPELCEITLLSRGCYGFVFSIRLHEVMGEQINNPFNTFRIDTDGTFIHTSYATNERGKHSTFCCKLVPILDPPLSIQITLPKQNIIQQDTSTKLAFNNECNKQRQIYALTNDDLNSVCLPLFYFNIVKLSTDSICKKFIRFIFEQTGITIPSPPSDLHYGISFMPLSPNTYSTTQKKPQTPSSIAFITGENPMETILYSVRESYSTYVLHETRVIEIFRDNPFIYPLVSVISLLMRLYSVGYCHGDLHSGNIVVCPTPSGMTDGEPIIYFNPTVALIDTGYAYKHGQSVPDDFSTNYRSFKLVIKDIITRRAPKLGQNMLTHRPYNWFPKFFMANITSQKPTLDPVMCKSLFRLFYYYEGYRINFESQQVGFFNTLHQGQIENIRAQNQDISESVDTYIESIPKISPEAKLLAFNSLGGRRRNYYVSNRKQTNRIKTNRKQPKITKKHTTRSVRRRHRRKSQHPRQRHSKSKYY